MATRKNGKRKSPSAERLLALALVRVVECVRLERSLGEQLKAGDTSPDYEAARTSEREAVEDAMKVLADNGYGELESIASRVSAINDQIQAALSMGDGKALALLGPALERAKRGLPPIAKVEKKQKPATTERKAKVSKAVKAILDAFDKETLADTQGRVVTSIKAALDGKACLVQFEGDDSEWITVDPKDLKPVPAKEPGELPEQSEAGQRKEIT